MTRSAIVAAADLTIPIGLMNAYNRLAISFRAEPTALAESAREPQIVQAGSLARSA
jgi:hypothetical protein